MSAATVDSGTPPARGRRDALALPRQRLPALDGLRGVAALVVVVYHTLRLNDGFRHGIFHFKPDNFSSWLLTVTPLRALFDGHLAVWLFFALSGFVLSRRHWQGGKTKWPVFFMRRALRLYLPVFGSVASAIVLLGVRQELLDTGNGLVDLGAMGTSVSLIVHNMGLVALVDTPLNGVWWSMRWEVWFSILVLPLLAVLGLVGCGAQRRFRWAPAAFGILCVLAVAVLPWVSGTFAMAPVWTLALRYLPMFGVGIAVAAYEDELRKIRWLNVGPWGWLALAGCVVLIGAVGPLGALRVNGLLPDQIASGLSNGLAVLGVGLLVGLFVGWPAGITALCTRPVQWIGKRSYSLYLVHLPLLHVLTAALSMDAAPFWYVGLIVAASLAYCAPFYRWVEAPSIRLSKWVGRRRPAGPASEGGSREPTVYREPVAAL